VLGDGGVALHFAVRDAGVGIAEDKQLEVFGAFSQADSSITRRFGGTGLGLAISHKLVLMMGGRVWLESELGKGSVFHFTLRLGLGKENAATSECDLLPFELAPQQALHILLAEDNLINQRLALALLEKRGHRVVVANNGQEALDAVEKGAFDLVLMDIQMPVMDGVEATLRIRERERAPGARHLAIVAMTANAMQGDRERFLAAGMDGYVSKPVKPDELFAEIAVVLGAGATALLPPPVVYEPHIYRRAEVLERMGGDEELFQTLAGMFVADSASYCSALEQALAAADAPTLQREAHTIKGLLATFSEDTGTALAQQLEESAKRGDLDKADVMAAGLVVAVKRLAAALSSELA
jgi:CheY-like chemotaxis protein